MCADPGVVVVAAAAAAVAAPGALSCGAAAAFAAVAPEDLDCATIFGRQYIKHIKKNIYIYIYICEDRKALGALDHKFLTSM